uniref:Si:ch73-335m24.2 n=1 Tax=Sander lucioperca TaxID=283035 RepID=A0A8D0A684_SANLU
QGRAVKTKKNEISITLCSLLEYLHTILKNHTAHACEGDTLIIECPSRTSVAVLSAFYGRRVPNQHLCPSANTNTSVEEDKECTSPKVLSECQDRRSCHIPVFSPVFGQDPCPLTSKYLLVAYKCRPEHHRTRLVCENERLRLMCKNETVLAIYSATFGHLLHGSPYLEELAFQTAQFKNTSIVFLRNNFTAEGKDDIQGGEVFICSFMPCFKFRLIYDHHNPRSLPGLPERVALYFVSGICAGLVFLLCLFGIRSTLVRDVKDLVSDLKDELKASRRQRKELMEDLFDDDISDTSSFCRLTQSYRTTEILSPSTLTVEMADSEVDQTRDQPNGDIWPHRDSSPYNCGLFTVMPRFNIS